MYFDGLIGLGGGGSKMQCKVSFCIFSSKLRLCLKYNYVVDFVISSFSQIIKAIKS